MKMMNKTVQVLLAATFLQVAAQNAVAQEPSIGVQMYTLRNSGTLEDQLGIARNAGFNNVELVGTHGKTASEMNALLDRYGLKATSSHIQLSDLTDTSNQPAAAKIDDVIAFNRAVGNNVIVVPFLPNPPTTAQGWAELGSRLGVISDRLQANGMTLLYHNHFQEIQRYGDKYALEILLDAAGPNVKSELDLAWVTRAGQDPVEVLKRLHGRVSIVHAKDNIAGMENTDFSVLGTTPESGFAAVGAGVLNWRQIIPAVYASGAGTYIVEHDNPNDAAATIRRGNEYLLANYNLRPDFGIFAATPNQSAVAAAINGLDPVSQVYSAAYLTTGSTASALEQLSGATHASTQSTLVQDTQLFASAVSNRINNAFSERAEGSAPEMSIGELTFWTEAMASRGEQDKAATGEIDRSARGFLMGADALFMESWTVGLTAGYSRSSIDNWNSDAKSDNYHVGVYAGTTFGAFSLKTGLGYSRHEIETKRNVAIAAGAFSLAETLSADYSANALQAFGEVAYLIDANGFSFEPYAGLSHVMLKSDAFRESGGAAALSSNGETVNTTFTTLGVRTATDLDLGAVQAVARTGLGWRHAFGDVDPASSVSFSAGNSFDVSSAVAKDVALVEAGLDFNIAPSAVVGVSYTGQFGSGERSNAVNASLKVKF